MDPANLPYSSAKKEQPGFDMELARALAERLHVKLRVEWLDVQHETAVGKLLEHQCDLVFGEAVAANVVADDEELAGKLLYSRPYYRTGYVLVERKNGPHVQSLAELKGAKSQRLGTEAGSVADYSLRQRGYLRRLYRNQLATLKALTTETSTMPISGPTWAGRCTPHPNGTSSSLQIMFRSTTGTLRSRWTVGTTSSSVRLIAASRR